MSVIPNQMTSTGVFVFLMVPPAFVKMIVPGSPRCVLDMGCKESVSVARIKTVRQAREPRFP